MAMGTACAFAEASDFEVEVIPTAAVAHERCYEHETNKWSGWTCRIEGLIVSMVRLYIPWDRMEVLFVRVIVSVQCRCSGLRGYEFHLGLHFAGHRIFVFLRN